MVQSDMIGDADQNKASCLEVVLKWISSIVIGLVFLVCLTHSKISLLALSKARHASNEDIDLDGRYRIFVLLQIISLVPHTVNLIRGVWYGILRKDRKWPNKKTFFLATIISIIESFGLCLFTFSIPGLCKAYHAVLLMNCVIILPICANLLNPCIKKLIRGQGTTTSSSHGSDARQQMLMFFAVVFCLAGIGLTVVMLLHVKTNWWLAPLGVICLSVAWISPIQKGMAERKKESNNNSNNVKRDDGPSTSNYSIQNQMAQDSKPAIENTTWKLTALMSFVKIISTFGFSMLILYIFEETEKGYFVGYIACTTRSQIVGFSIPLALATPLSVCILAVKATCQAVLLVHDYSGGESKKPNNHARALLVMLKNS